MTTSAKLGTAKEPLDTNVLKFCNFVTPEIPTEGTLLNTEWALFAKYLIYLTFYSILRTSV